MKRREFISLLGGAATAFPLTARAQQGDRMRRIGLLMGYPEGDAEGLASVAAFKRGLQDLGWTEGRNVRVETRWAGSDPVKSRTFAKELIAMTPDVIVPSTNLVTGILQQETRTIPIVFVLVGDPVLSGYVASLAQPGGNMTGFSNLEQSVSSKWVEILKEIAPSVRRLGVVVHMETPATVGLLRWIETAAPSLGIQVTALGVRTAGEIERAVSGFASEPTGALIILPHAVTFGNRDLLIGLAAKYHLPAIYAFRLFATSGGLVSYGSNSIDPFRQGATYVSRILKGAKPADLPVQFPTRYELVINLKTAKALGLTVPSQLLARADEVIE